MTAGDQCPRPAGARPAVLVAGAGVMGLVTAITLAERGFAVTVSDQAPGFGPAMASWAAGGMLAPWCEQVGADPRVADWGAMAIDWWADHLSLVSQAGTLVVAPARDAGELGHFARRTDHYRWLDGDEIAALEPDLAGRFIRALYFPDEAHLDPRRALPALADQLIRRGGRLCFGIPLEQLQQPGQRLVDCRGWAAAADLPDLRPVRGEMLLVRCPDLQFSRPVRLLHPRIPLYVVPRGQGLFMIGATMIESSRADGVSVRSAVELLSGAYALHPAFGEAEVVEMTAGLRPAFADNLPAVRPTAAGLAVNGAYRHGFLCSPWIAREAANLLEQQLFSLNDGARA